MPAPDRVSFVVGASDAGRRLDQVLAARVPGLSRRQARLLLDIGGVFVAGRRVKLAGRLARAGEEIVAVRGGALARASKRLGLAARRDDEQRLPPYVVVLEDEDVVVVDKPPGLLTAPTPESDRNNLAAMLARRPSGRGDPERVPEPPREGRSSAEPSAVHAPAPVFVVHRIDLDTSGLIVFAKTAAANRALAEAFRTHDVEREYLAVVAGAFPDARRAIDRPVGGRRAVTHVTVRERFGTVATLLACRLETGRTHQIRLHAAGVGHPVVGDARYGARFAGPPPPRTALHATTLGFAHPRLPTRVSLTSPLPADLAAWIEALRAADR